MFEMVNAISSTGATPGDVIDDPLQDLYQALRDHILTLGDDVQEKRLKYYVAFKRIRNFVCVEVRPSKSEVRAYLKIDPDEVDLLPGFTRDVRGVGHYGTGDLEVRIRTLEGLERAKPLFQQSYEAS